MPEQIIQQVPQEGKAQAIMSHMKAFAERIVENAREHPELYSSIAGAGTGALLGSQIAENSMEGALKGAALGGASGYALNQILKNPPPAIPTIEEYKEQPSNSALEYPVNHPIKTGLVGGALAIPTIGYGRYKLNKHFGDVVEKDINGIEKVTKEGIFSIFKRFMKGDPKIFKGL